MNVIATISLLLPLAIISMMIIWENIQWLGKNIGPSTGKINSRKAWVLSPSQYNLHDVENGILPFPKQQVLDCSRLKEFADDNFSCNENGRKFSKWVENSMRKGEIARYEQFLLVQQCFQKTCIADTEKPGPVWEKVKTRVCIHQPFSRTFFIFFSKICKLECNTTSDWQNHML